MPSHCCPASGLRTPASGPQFLEMNSAEQGSSVVPFPTLGLTSSCAQAPCRSPWKMTGTNTKYTKYLVTPKRQHGPGNKETNGKLQHTEKEKRICYYSKHLHLVKGWIAVVLHIFSMKTRLPFKGLSENLGRLNCMVLKRPGQNLLKFGCSNKKREIMFKKAKIKSCFSR